MVDLTTTYLGLQLKNPLVASASPLSEKVETAQRLEEAGIAAIVMYSLFEEQIIHESLELDHYLSQGTETFQEALTSASLTADSQTAVGCEVVSVVEDPSPFLKKFDPNHPDAGPDGYVQFPNINVVSEMVDIQEASRAYEANISVILAIKNMIAKTFEIGRR